ncbi:MAG: hypothetical protein H6682_19250 [Candidatus Eisenbacteria bacterium]|nr:hypothetical protein [Candidatus Eisenbacteria bacterium]
MAKFSDQLTDSHIEFIEAQKMFFVATAPRDGRVVPFYEFLSARDTLVRTAESVGPEKMLAYQRENNVTSIDGLPTGLFPETGNEAGNA